jgi:hypothetical protein
MNKTIAIIALAAGALGTGAAIKVNTDLPKPEVTVVQINAEWNEKNPRRDLEDLRGCEYKFGWLEDQPKALQESVTAVPVVVIYDGGKPAWQYTADISFRLQASFREIQDKVYDLQQDRIYEARD